MKKEKLLKLGFKDMSFNFPNGRDFEKLQFEINNYKLIEFYGNSVVNICIENEWVNVPNCKTIDDMKNLIKLFS